MITLNPQDVEVIVFWTRNAAPLLPHLDELDQRGFRYYFQYTLNGYGAPLEPDAPRLTEAVATFCELSRRLGPERVIWRYDPIILGSFAPPEYHVSRFADLATSLKGATRRVMVSVATFYRKTDRRLAALEREGATFERVKGHEPHVRELLAELAAIAAGKGMKVYSCASETSYEDVGIPPGRCIDGELIQSLFGIAGHNQKDPGQRKACGCAVSRDIGVVDTCLHGCLYCYATRNDEIARQRHAEHILTGEAMWGKWDSLI